MLSTHWFWYLFKALFEFQNYSLQVETSFWHGPKYTRVMNGTSLSFVQPNPVPKKIIKKRPVACWQRKKKPRTREIFITGICNQWNVKMPVAISLLIWTICEGNTQKITNKSQLCLFTFYHFAVLHSDSFFTCAVGSLSSRLHFHFRHIRWVECFFFCFFCFVYVLAALS